MAETATLLDDYRFVLAPTRRAKGPAGGPPSPDTLRRSLLRVVRSRPQVMVKITSFAKSKEGLAAHLDYLSRNGQNEVLDAMGEGFSQIAQDLGIESPREAIQRYGRELATANQDERPRKGRPRSRVSMNLMLSMPPGTDQAAFELAVGDFLVQQFGAHDFLYTFHDDREHYHAHVVVGLQDHDGRWLNPRKGDLLEWRQSFAANLERHGIEADATPAYSRGRGKQGFRRDLEELKQRGTRRYPDASPTFDAELEEKAIKQRADAWSRIAAHYAQEGDRETAGAIREYLAEHYDIHPAPDRSRSRDGGRER